VLHSLFHAKSIALEKMEHATVETYGSNLQNDTSRQRNTEEISSLPQLEEEESVTHGPTNNEVLGIAFYSFLGFTLLQTSFAVHAKSSAMIADSEAMFIDAGTYLCNLLAEKLKNRPLSVEEKRLSPLLLHHKRKLQRLYLELFPPAISVCTLLYVTFTTLESSTETLFDCGPSVIGADNPPNVKIMMLFSLLNLVVDVANVYLFAKVEHTVLTIEVEQTEESPLIELVEEKDAKGSVASLTMEPSFDDDDISEVKLNLNMFSAWTHVFADTMRSIAVLLAGGISYFTNIISPEVADASAALIVSLIIFLSCLPLFNGLYKTCREIIILKRGPLAKV